MGQCCVIVAEMFCAVWISLCVCASSARQGKTGTIYLDNDLLFDAVGTVDPLDDMVRATVLNYSISYFYFPFKHAHHKLPIKQELSTAI